MSLAYCVLAHRNPAQVARLLRAIWSPENIYVLHYERRTPFPEQKAIEALSSQYSNVRVLRSRAVLWGRYSQLKAQLDGLRICTEWGIEWTHYINLTGQDFPLVAQAAIMRELKSKRDISFVSWSDPFTNGEQTDVNDRISRIHLDSPLLERILGLPGIGRRVKALFGWSNRLPYIPLIRRAKPNFFRYYKGANHFILSNEASLYLLDDVRSQEIVRRLKWTGSPDESVVQTVLMNSRLADRLVNDDRRAIYWERTGDPSPKTLTSADLPRLEAARGAGKLFGRKFDDQVDEGVMRILEEQLSQ